MKQNHSADHGGLPAWFSEELARTPEPSPDQLARYDYLKDDVLAAMREQYQEATGTAPVPEPTRTFVDVVFDLAGRLLDWAAGTEAVSLHPTPAFQACTTRGGGTARSAKSPLEGAQAVATKNVPGLRIEVKTMGIDGKLHLGVGVMATGGKGDYLPFQVCIFDDRDELVEGPDSWDGGKPACYPEPQRGVYRIEVEAAGHRGTIIAEFC